MKELKKIQNIRIYPTIKKVIEGKFESVQKFIDKMIQKEIGEIDHEIKVIKVKKDKK